ncbi:hypothetical protein ABZ348_22795 [Streptomyces sp. NPDC005963]|uniref:hypothetical protein n=1 Tax=Streptomyces sp. NPDC005963 TaxID=3156721 RepID=UPI0033DC0F8A
MSGLARRPASSSTGSEECFLYWAQVIAHYPPERDILGVFVTPYAARAMRWLCVQAVRIANGLDLEPDVPWSAALISIDARLTLDLDLGDAPTTLRAWVADEDARRPIVQNLKAGQPFSLEVADWAGRYEFTARPWQSHEPGGLIWDSVAALPQRAP